MKSQPLIIPTSIVKLNVSRAPSDTKIIAFPTAETPSNEPPPSGPALLVDETNKFHRLQLPEIQHTDNWMHMNQSAWIWFQGLPPNIKVALYDAAWRTYQKGNVNAIYPGSDWNNLFLQAQQLTRMLAA